MRKLKVTISYCGTNYHGFQKQVNAITVQNVLEDTLSKMLNETVVIAGCSRTDTGVHAKMFVFTFATDCTISCEGVVKGMNAMLPSDIAVLDCEEVASDFHARYSCKGKEYCYFIKNTSIRNPFSHDLELLYNRKLDIEKMQEAAKLIVGTHDFTSFCGTDNLKENAIRTVYKCDVEKNGDIVCITIAGDGFLYNMVRIIVGTLLEVSEGRYNPTDVKAILDAKDRTKAGRTAAAYGLFLNKVFY